eukprot:1080963-Rhodomonas_salina.1
MAHVTSCIIAHGIHRRLQIADRTSCIAHCPSCIAHRTPHTAGQEGAPDCGGEAKSVCAWMTVPVREEGGRCERGPGRECGGEGVTRSDSLATSRGHKVTKSQGHKVTSHTVTRSQGHKVTRSQVTT